LLNAAIDKARERLAAIRAGTKTDAAEIDAGTGPETLATDADLDKLARQVGIGAVKFADLSSFRTLGYMFNPDRMVSFEGRTGPYVQYACVRIQSILTRARDQGISIGTMLPEHAAERALLLECARFPEVVKSAAANLAPNELTDYVFGLAQAFSRFYSECPVLAADTAALQGSRLAMSTLCLRVLAQGLYLLGISVPDRM
jgi:arginyl-tRNA synthetase